MSSTILLVALSVAGSISAGLVVRKMLAPTREIRQCVMCHAEYMYEAPTDGLRKPEHVCPHYKCFFEFHELWLAHDWLFAIPNDPPPGTWAIHDTRGDVPPAPQQGTWRVLY